MILKRIKVKTPMDDLLTNCYIVQDTKTKQAIVIDPGAEFEKIDNMLNVLDAKVKYIYLTHCHGDHIGAVNQLKQKTKANVLIHRADSNGLTDDNINLATYIGMPETKVTDFYRVDDGDLLHLGNLEFKVIHTPGHTKGGSSLYCKQKGLLFSGDTMFHGTWGRTDLPTGSIDDIMNSITNKLLKLPDLTIVYPGHGKSTLIMEERPIYCDLHPRIDI